MVSHELRAPLTSIKGSTATVLHASPVPHQAELLQFFRIIDGQADHMRGLIANLLDAGSIEAGTLTIAPEPSNVAALVDRARTTFLSGGGPASRRHRPPAGSPAGDGRPGAHRTGAQQPLLERGPALSALLGDPRRGGARGRLHRALGLGPGAGDPARPAPAPLPQARQPRRRHRARPRDLEGPRRGARRAHLRGERGGGARRPIHVHDPGGRGRRPRGSPARRPAAPTRREGGEDARPRGSTTTRRRTATCGTRSPTPATPRSSRATRTGSPESSAPRSPTSSSST